MSIRAIRAAYAASVIATAAAAAWLVVGIVATVRDAVGPNRLEVPLRVEKVAIAEVFYDIGQGYRPEDSKAVVVAPGTAAGGWLRVTSFPLPRVPVRELRVDPMTFEGKFAIGEARLTSASGRELARMPLEWMRPANQIAEFKRVGDRIEAGTTAGANDAHFVIMLATPLPVGAVAVPWARAGWLALVGALAWRLRRKAGPLDGTKAKAAWERLRAGSGVGAGMAIVGAVELWILWPLHATLDWPLWDEANYAAAGANWARAGGGFGELHSSPLYVASYAVLSQLGGLATAIFAQHYFVKLGSTLLLYLVLARWWRSWGAAAAVAIAWGATQFQTEFPMLVYQHAWVWLLAGLLTVDRWPLAGLGFVAMATGVRQEYQFVLAAGVVWLGWRAGRGRSWRWLLARERRGRNLAIGAVGAVAVWSVVGAVLLRTSFAHSEGRAWFAFQQHYAVRAVATGEVTGLDPWLDYPRVVGKDFPGAQSLGDAWRINAAAVARHVKYNLKMAPVEIARLGEPHVGLGVAAGILAFGAVILLVATRRPKEAGGGEVPSSVVLAAAGVVAIAPGLVVLAKGAYLLPVVPAVIGGAGWLARRAADERRRLAAGGALVVAAGVCAVIGAPRVFVAGARPRVVAETVAELAKGWPAGGREALLGVSASSYAHYVGDERCLGVEPFSEASGTAGASQGLAELVANFSPRAVLVTDDWRRSARFDENEIARVLAAPAWERRTVAAGDVYWRRR